MRMRIRKTSKADSTRSSWDPSPSLNREKIAESTEIKKWVDSYLAVGEWTMDQSVAILGSSKYFERRR